MSLFYQQRQQLQRLVQPLLWGCLGRLQVKRKNHSASYYAIGAAFLRRLHKNDILAYAYGLAFNFTMAIFPAIIAVFTLIPHLPITALAPKIVSSLQEMMPAGLYNVLAPTIQDTLGTRRGGLLSAGFFSTLYLATNGMTSLIKTFEIFHKDPLRVPRSYLKKRGLAFCLTLVLGLVLLCAMALLIVGRQLLHQAISQGLIASKFQLFLLLALRFLTVALLLFVAIASIYCVAPATQRPWPFFSLGAFVATLLSLLASFGFSYYVSNFANYNRIYGSIGIFIALMTWLFILSAVLLVGFECNASIDTLGRLEAQKKRR